MKRPYMKCHDKIKKTCKRTGNDCNHAVKHKKNRWCDIVDKLCSTCVPYKGKQNVL
jgi:hypothetical protein